MLFATIFLVAFVLLGGVALYLARTIEHGEARFDSETGKLLRDETRDDTQPVAAKRIEQDDERNEQT